MRWSGRKEGVRQMSLGRAREEWLPRPRARQSFPQKQRAAGPSCKAMGRGPRCSPGWAATHSLVQEGHEVHDSSVPVRNRAEGLWMIPEPWT